ncbi:MAG: hypothetical protein ACPG21_05050 [Crocinitomicaceae bacterium]
MKRIILLGSLFFALAVKAQNVDENKVSVTYIQLPTNVINKAVKVYEVDITRAYEQANEDSLNQYQIKLESAASIYEAELVQWKAQCEAMDRDYLTRMAAWEKQTSGASSGVPPTSPPQAPVYPAHPIQQEVELPRMHNDLDDNMVNNGVDLKGFDKGSGGAIITVDMYPISEFKINENKVVKDGVMSYEYYATYKLPIGLKVEDPSQGVVLQTIVANNVQRHNMKTYSYKYDFQLWWMDNADQFWIDFEKVARRNAVNQLNSELNEKCGFPVKSRTIEIFTVKRFKDHNYSDLTNAYTMATQGYQKVGNTRDRSEAHAKLTEAIEAWKNILKESDLSDNKSRINDKVTALLQCNIVMAYIWMSEFDDAEVYINLAKNSGVGKFERVARGMSGLLNERKQRWNAYF